MGINMKKLILIVILLIGIIGNSQNKKYTTYRVSQHETISSIARKLGITPYDLLKLNPDANDGISIDEVLIIPNKKHTKNLVLESQITMKEKDTIVDECLYHKVKPSETIYFLSSKYKISKRKVRKINKLNRKGDISIGQILKFPLSLIQYDKKEVVVKSFENINKEDNIEQKNTFKYKVNEHDTLFSITQKYNVTEEKLKDLNPSLKDGLKAEMEILIPFINGAEVKEALLIPEKEEIKYKKHVVKAKEGFFRLKQQYGISKEELIKVNPELEKGLKTGMEIKIPIRVENNLMVDGDLHGKTVNLVMLMPFNIKEDSSFSNKTKTAKKLNNVIDFYLGSLMALDSLKSKGLSVNVKVFDTKKSDFVVNKIMNNYDFNSTDLVIAPIKINRFKIVANQLQSKKIPVISPISKKNYSSIGISNCIQNTPTNELLTDSVLSYIKESYSDQKVLIIADETKQNTVEDYDINLISSQLKKDSNIKEVTVIRMKDGYIERELFEKNIVNNKNNWVLLASVKPSTTSIAVNNLAVFSSDYRIKLFSLKKPKNLELSSENFLLKNKYLNKLKFQYPELNFVDYNDESIIDFNMKYNKKFGNIPSKYSYKGFDATYDALIRIANFNDIQEAFKAGKSYRTITKFDYKPVYSNDFVNKGVYFVRYNNYNIEKVF